VQPRQQHDHGVQQPGDRLIADAGGEQRPVGQRELEVFGEQDRIEGLALGVAAGADHTDRLDRRRL